MYWLTIIHRSCYCNQKVLQIFYVVTFLMGHSLSRVQLILQKMINKNFEKTLNIFKSNTDLYDYQ